MRGHTSQVEGKQGSYLFGGQLAQFECFLQYRGRPLHSPEHDFEAFGPQLSCLWTLGSPLH